jgi:hypothetical protein
LSEIRGGRGGGGGGHQRQRMRLWRSQQWCGWCEAAAGVSRVELKLRVLGDLWPTAIRSWGVVVGSGWSHQDKKTSRVVWCGEEAVGLWGRSYRATWGK